MTRRNTLQWSLFIVLLGQWAHPLLAVSLQRMCIGQPFGTLLPNPVDCNSFYVCRSEPHLTTCSPGLHFDRVNKVCNWPRWANCRLDELDTDAPSEQHSIDDISKPVSISTQTMESVETTSISKPVSISSQTKESVESASILNPLSISTQTKESVKTTAILKPLSVSSQTKESVETASIVNPLPISSQSKKESVETAGISKLPSISSEPKKESVNVANSSSPPSTPGQSAQLNVAVPIEYINLKASNNSTKTIPQAIEVGVAVPSDIDDLFKNKATSFSVNSQSEVDGEKEIVSIPSKNQAPVVEFNEEPSSSHESESASALSMLIIEKIAAEKPFSQVIGSASGGLGGLSQGAHPQIQYIVENVEATVSQLDSSEKVQPEKPSSQVIEITSEGRPIDSASPNDFPEAQAAVEKVNSSSSPQSSNQEIKIISAGLPTYSAVDMLTEGHGVVEMVEASNSQKRPSLVIDVSATGSLAWQEPQAMVGTVQASRPQQGSGQVIDIINVGLPVLLSELHSPSVPEVEKVTSVQTPKDAAATVYLVEQYASIDMSQLVSSAMGANIVQKSNTVDTVQELRSRDTSEFVNNLENAIELSRPTPKGSPKRKKELISVDLSTSDEDSGSEGVDSSEERMSEDESDEVSNFDSIENGGVKPSRPKKKETTAMKATNKQVKKSSKTQKNKKKTNKQTNESVEADSSEEVMSYKKPVKAQSKDSVEEDERIKNSLKTQKNKKKTKESVEADSSEEIMSSKKPVKGQSKDSVEEDERIKNSLKTQKNKKKTKESVEADSSEEIMSSKKPVKDQSKDSVEEDERIKNPLKTQKNKKKTKQSVEADSSEEVMSPKKPVKDQSKDSVEEDERIKNPLKTQKNKKKTKQSVEADSSEEVMSSKKPVKAESKDSVEEDERIKNSLKTQKNKKKTKESVEADSSEEVMSSKKPVKDQSKDSVEEDERIKNPLKTQKNKKKTKESVEADSSEEVMSSKKPVKAQSKDSVEEDERIKNSLKTQKNKKKTNKQTKESVEADSSEEDVSSKKPLKAQSEDSFEANESQSPEQVKKKQTKESSSSEESLESDEELMFPSISSQSFYEIDAFKVTPPEKKTVVNWAQAVGKTLGSIQSNVVQDLQATPVYLSTQGSPSTAVKVSNSKQSSSKNPSLKVLEVESPLVAAIYSTAQDSPSTAVKVSNSKLSSSKNPSLKVLEVESPLVAAVYSTAQDSPSTAVKVSNSKLSSSKNPSGKVLEVESPLVAAVHSTAQGSPNTAVKVSNSKNPSGKVLEVESPPVASNFPATSPNTYRPPSTRPSEKKDNEQWNLSASVLSVASVRLDEAENRTNNRPTVGAHSLETGHPIEVMTGYNVDNVQCIHDGLYFLPHPSDCQKYFICAYRHLHLHSCGSSLTWSYKREQCELFSEARCFSREANATSEENAKAANPGNQAKPTRAQSSANDIPVTTRVKALTPMPPLRTTEVPAATEQQGVQLPECPSYRQAYLPSIDDCNHYYICILGQAVLTSCPDSLFWDARGEFCGKESEVKCAGK